MKMLFNYRPDGHFILTNKGEKKIMVIRSGPKGIVTVIEGGGLVIIWPNDVADTHNEDSEVDLIQKTIDVLNS